MNYMTKLIIECAPYILNNSGTNFRNVQSSRCGQIFKVTHQDFPGFVGYSDLVFTPEYWGAFQPTNVNEFDCNYKIHQTVNNFSSLIEHNLFLAVQDMLQKFKLSQKELSEHPMIHHLALDVNSEKSITDIIQQQLNFENSHYNIQDLFGFLQQLDFLKKQSGTLRFKIKLGADEIFWQDWLSAVSVIQNYIDVHQIRAKILWRLDFNSTLNVELLQAFLNLMQQRGLSLSAVEFIEDPMPWSYQDWTYFNQLVPLALDFELDNLLTSEFETNDLNSAFQFLVYKPSRQSQWMIFDLLKKSKAKLVITHMQDSWIGKSLAVRHYSEIKNRMMDSKIDEGWVLDQQQLAIGGLGLENPWSVDDIQTFLQTLKFEVWPGKLNSICIDTDAGFQKLVPSLYSDFFWSSWQSYLFLNPRMPTNEKQQIISLVERFYLPGHIWIASSGSSQKPSDSVKVIALSKHAILQSAKAVNEFLGADRLSWVQALPFFHVGGFSLYARAYLAQTQVIMGLKTSMVNRSENIAESLIEPQLQQEKMQVQAVQYSDSDLHYYWDPEFYFQTLTAMTNSDSDSVTKPSGKMVYSSLVPTQVYDLVKRGVKAPKCIRNIIVGGSALDLELLKQARQLGWPLSISYGMTEVASQIATSRADSEKLIVLNHIQLKNSDDGYLMVQSKSMMSGWAQWKDGSAQFYSQPQAGWYTTSDFVEIVTEEISDSKNESLRMASSRHSVLQNQMMNKVTNRQDWPKPTPYLIPKGRGSDFVKIKGEGVNIANVEKQLFDFLSKQVFLSNQESYSALNAQDWSQKILLAVQMESRDGAELVLLIQDLADLPWEQWLQSYNQQCLFPLNRIFKIKFVDQIPKTALGKKHRFFS